MAAKKFDVQAACRPKREAFEAAVARRKKRGGAFLNTFTSDGRDSNRKAAKAKKAWQECLRDHDGATPRFWVHGFARAATDVGVDGAPSPDSVPASTIQGKKKDKQVAKVMKARNLADARVRAEAAAKKNKIHKLSSLAARSRAAQAALKATVAGSAAANTIANVTTAVLLAIPEPAITKGTAAIIKGSTVAATAAATTAAKVVATNSENKYQTALESELAKRGKKLEAEKRKQLEEEMARTEELSRQAAMAKLQAAQDEEARIEWYEDPVVWVGAGVGVAFILGVGVFAARK